MSRSVSKNSIKQNQRLHCTPIEDRDFASRKKEHSKKSFATPFLPLIDARRLRLNWSPVDDLSLRSPVSPTDEITRQIGRDDMVPTGDTFVLKGERAFHSLLALKTHQINANLSIILQMVVASTVASSPGNHPLPNRGLSNGSRGAVIRQCETLLLRSRFFSFLQNVAHITEILRYARSDKNMYANRIPLVWPVNRRPGQQLTL